MSICEAITERILSQDKENSYEVLSSELESNANVWKETREKSMAKANDLIAKLPDTLKRAWT